MPDKRPHIAIIGAGMAGIACARTLLQAGHRVQVFEAQGAAGGRMATHQTPFGSFDAGAQYFTVRDERFALALQTVPGLCRPWSANTVRVLDAQGRVAAASLPPAEPHLLPVPGMDTLVQRWAAPLQTLTGAQLHLHTRVLRLERDSTGRWQLYTVNANNGKPQATKAFDVVLLATPAAVSQALLQGCEPAQATAQAMASVRVAPCWTLMAAFPQAMQPGLGSLGPQWNAARSTHHRIAWVARESSKPGRSSVERWTVQASAKWSAEHLDDTPARVQAKLLKAFSEVTGIRADPTHAEVRRWADAQTQTPLGRSHLWDAQAGLGACGDWCLGHRVENAFVSGLELALAVA
jgi:renalase